MYIYDSIHTSFAPLVACIRTMREIGDTIMYLVACIRAMREIGDRQREEELSAHDAGREGRIGTERGKHLSFSRRLFERFLYLSLKKNG